MYNKLFLKILDSSIWLEPTATRITWITLLAAMNEDGYAHFSAIENLANRARVTVEEARAAVECFLAPDPSSGDPDHEGRRVERVPGGFMILNATKHRETLNRVVALEQNRLRVKRFREKNAGIDGGNSTWNNEKRDLFTQAEGVYGIYPKKVAKKVAISKIASAIKEFGFDKVMEATKTFATAWSSEKDLQFCPHPATWYGQHRFNDDPATWVRKENVAIATLVQPKPPSTVWELTQIIEAKTKQAQKLKNQYTFEDAMGVTWKDKEKHAEYSQLRKQINELNQKLGEKG